MILRHQPHPVVAGDNLAVVKLMLQVTANLTV